MSGGMNNTYKEAFDMSEVISIKQKRYQKELKYEKKMLRELSLTEIKHQMNYCFGKMIDNGRKKIIEEACVDYAIEAFLLGAKYSRFGYYGETMDAANKRCQHEEKRLIDEFYDYFLNWGKVKINDVSYDELYIASEHYIHTFWQEGFIKGEKRYKLRLH